MAHSTNIGEGTFMNLHLIITQFSFGGCHSNFSSLVWVDLQFLSNPSLPLSNRKNCPGCSSVPLTWNTRTWCTTSLLVKRSLWCFFCLITGEREPGNWLISRIAGAALHLMAAHGWPLPRASVMGPEARPLLQQPPSSPSSPPPPPAWH